MTTLNPDRLLAELKRYGVPALGHGPWRERTAGGTPDFRSIGVHDSVTGSMSNLTAVNFCIKGKTGVPGPLYALMMGSDGVANLLSVRRSNNIGRTRKQRVDLARAGGFPLDRELPAPGEDDYGDGNAEVFGFAFITAGAGPYTPIQYSRGILALAALGHALDWSPDEAVGSMGGHQEFTRRKGDPKFDMGSARRAVRAAMLTPPGATPAPRPPVSEPTRPSTPAAPAAGDTVAGVMVQGSLPVLRAGMRDPIAFKGGTYVRRLQVLLNLARAAGAAELEVNGAYSPVVERAVADVNARLLKRTVDGKTVDAMTWERLVGMQG